jgi:hypothetical protein
MDMNELDQSSCFGREIGVSAPHHANHLADRPAEGIFYATDKPNVPKSFTELRR